MRRFLTPITRKTKALWVWLRPDEIFRDVSYSLRVLRRSSGYTTVVVLTLAIGIGANTAIFTLINSVALRSLPVPDPHQLLLFEWAARKDPASDDVDI
jgi:hypothetical protein